MGVPQRPLRLLLPELRDDRRQGGVRAQHRCRSAEGPGVGRRADLNRIARIRVRERDLFGQWASRWRVIRTSNAYVFRDPQQRPEGVPASKSENQIGTLNQEVLDASLAPAGDPDNPLEQALQQLSGAIKARLLMNKDGGMVPAT
jgi:hypothetical protein